MTSNAEHHFMHLLATGIFSLKKCLFSSSAHFSIELFDFLMLSIYAIIYQSLLVISFGNIFFHSAGLLFVLLIVSFAAQKLSV